MTDIWTDERLAAALGREESRLARLREDALRGEAMLACARVLGALHEERAVLAGIAQTIERAALQEDVGALAQAQQRLHEHRDRTRALQAQLQVLSADAHIDELTGCVDRVGFDAALAREWDRAARDGASVGLVVVDLGADGSPAGASAPAEAVRAIARTLQAVVTGPGAVVARIGTAHLAALLPQAQLDEVLGVGERLRLAAQGDPATGERLAVGVAAVEPSAASPELLLERAEAGAARAAAIEGRSAVAAGADGFYVPQPAPGRAPAPTPRRSR